MGVGAARSGPTVNEECQQTKPALFGEFGPVRHNRRGLFIRRASFMDSKEPFGEALARARNALCLDCA
jgi:hypothetical protein